MIAGTEVHAVLPWAHPFRMIDRVVRLTPHESAVTLKTVTAGDPVVRREGEEEPRFPSVLMLEGMSQTAALLFRETYGPESLASAPLLGYLKAKLRGEASPGDTIEYTVTAIKMTSRRGIFSGIARVGSTVVARSELAFGVAAP